MSPKRRRADQGGTDKVTYRLTPELKRDIEEVSNGLNMEEADYVRAALWAVNAAVKEVKYRTPHATHWKLAFTEILVRNPAFGASPEPGGV